jgi:Tfp pilus assembly protein FimT
MKTEKSRRVKHGGFSTIELMMVTCFLIFMVGIAIPSLMTAVYNTRLLGGASDLAGLMQRARIIAARQNAPYAIQYANVSGVQLAYVDLNNDNTFDNSEPQVEFSGTVTLASGAPNGSNGQPSAYVLVGDTSTGSVYTNSTTLGFSSRGLPCAFDGTTNPVTCATPATNYFVYYLTDTRMGAQGWAAVVVTKSGRTHVVMWDGTSWH